MSIVCVFFLGIYSGIQQAYRIIDFFFQHIYFAFELLITYTFANKGLAYFTAVRHKNCVLNSAQLPQITLDGSRGYVKLAQLKLQAKKV
uniref:Uncharacterized protein n=1 Tax=Glossina austeni TaxID=7395 RepID=A0A1A9UWM6_GLOAU